MLHSLPHGSRLSRPAILWVSPRRRNGRLAEDDNGLPLGSASGDLRLILHKRILRVVNDLPLFPPPARHPPGHLLELQFLRLPADRRGSPPG